MSIAGTVKSGSGIVVIDSVAEILLHNELSNVGDVQRR